MATQSLFETEPVDVVALADLAARSVPLDLIEYRPIRGGDLPRVTITTYAEQRRFHEAIGARVVSAGREFKRRK